MYNLEVLIAMNARAAGREAGHADSDGDDALVERIHAAATDETDLEFTTGFLNARKDG